MSFVRQSLRTRPPFGELGDPPLPHESTVLFEEEYLRVPDVQYVSQPQKTNETSGPKKSKRVLKTSSRKELAYADHVERLLIEDSAKKQRRRSWVSTNDLPAEYDKDWFLEKLLEKFEDIRSERVHPPYDNGGENVERIVERRYYIKKIPQKPKRNQLTSTTDLRTLGKKERLPSGISSATATSSGCSRCSTSTPTYVEALREQSDSLRHDFTELRSEIEQLLASQHMLFEQLQTKIQPNTGNRQATSNQTVPPITGKRSRSVSTESQGSTASSTSGKSTPVPQTTAKSPSPTTSPLSKSEFIADKSPSYVPAPPVTPYTGTKADTAAQKPPSNPSLSSVTSSRATTPPTNAPVTSKPPMVVRTSSINPSISSKQSSIAPTSSNNLTGGGTSSRPPINSFIAPRKLSIDSVASASAASRRSSEAPTPISMKAPPPIPPGSMPVHENELAHRRTLSPHSQIVATSASGLDSSTSSSRCSSSLSIQSISRSINKPPTITLGENELEDLVQYSSQLELAGFPTSMAPVIPNPGTSSTFWESVDNYIQDTHSRTSTTDTSSIHRSYYNTPFALDNRSTKQLDKYDLEIKAQETFIGSAPLLLPPIDTLT
ncbi:unnamed protein product [Adineta ricciae]|uniref:Uncharacterized protein n=1 Tax=Adineta ricciae TaxID=249248 RepID=A0A816DHB0_ADIRI|nr:unnamed protein product [Adineta ricciae]